MTGRKDVRLVAAASAIVGAVVGAAVGVSLTSGISYQASDPAAAERRVEPARPARTLQPDPEVEEWHEEAFFAIADALWISGPAVGDFSDIRLQSICDRYSQIVGRLAELPPPPSAPLAARLEQWVEASERTAEDCYLIPEDMGVPGFTMLMQRNAYEMGAFLFELETKVDLTAGP